MKQKGLDSAHARQSFLCAPVEGKAEKALVKESRMYSCLSDVLAFFLWYVGDLATL